MVPLLAEMVPDGVGRVFVAALVCGIVVPVAGLVFTLCLLDWLMIRKPPNRKPRP